MAKNKKTGKRILTFFLILICLITALCIWQRDNIKAFIESYTMSEEDIAERAHKDVQKIKNYFEQNNLKEVRDLTEEEQQALLNDEISEEQAISIIKDEITLEEAKKQSKEQKEDNKTTTQKDDKNPPADKPTKQEDEIIDYDTKISNLVAQVYVLRAKFTSSLSGLEATVNNAFYSLPASQRNTANKNRIIAEYTQSALNMQANCDAQMNSILKELESVLKKAGRDTSIVNTIKTSYENEKSATKSMYIKKYLD